MLRLFSFSTITCLVLLTYQLSGQNWVIKDQNSIDSVGIKDLKPQKSFVYELDDNAMHKKLWEAPHERDINVNSSRTVISVGLADGSLDDFKIVEYSMMEEGLAAKFPDIKTFYGVSTTDKYRKIRIDYTLQGFRAVIRGAAEGSTFIDHYQRNDLGHRVVYYRSDYVRKNFWKCDFQNEGNIRDNNKDEGSRVGSTKLRTYRLALACTGEYSVAISNPASTAASMSAMTTSMNRVNQVYEEEVAVRMILIANTNLLIYLNGSTDPYTNNSGGTMLTENQNNVTTVIGSANYDIGHVFSTGGGGVASLGSVCLTNNKARGVTGSGNPTGDPFDIDYVAHEMGHQFGGRHTFASVSGSCNGNGTPAVAFEPGSGTTIQAYAGICSPSNVQNNSDPYFHAISLEEMTNFAQIGNGNGCATQIGVENQAPAITAQPTTYTIPKSTPFSLTLTATDPESNPIIYRWEQMNGGATVNTPSATATSGPLFRAIIPTSNSTRFFPRISNILDGSNGWTWEVLPSVSRTLSFRGVARDDNGQHGCFNVQNLFVTTVAAAGPFKVTGLDSPVSWNEGETKTITWDVSGTTANGINCANVSIFWTTNSGSSFTTLLAATPNDGSDIITVPSGSTTSGRIMVKGDGNVFLDINHANITVIANPNSFNLSANPSTITKCIGQNAVTSVTVTAVGAFNSPVTLSATNLPSGATASFSPNPVNPGSSSTLTISNLTTTGSSIVNIVGTSGAINKSVPITLNVVAGASVPTLTLPANLATNVSILPTLTWGVAVGAITYNVQLSYDALFTDLVQSGTSLSSTSFSISTPLYGNTVFYWRVQSSGSCGESAWSATRSFTTEPCWHYDSVNVPLNISSTGTPVIFSIMTISDRGTITDLNVRNLVGLHEVVRDLKFSLISPSNTTSLFWDRPCSRTDMNFNINFDDQATTNHPCPPTDGLTYLPTNPLNVFNTLAQRGIWNLKIEDVLDGSGGSLSSWGVKTCVNNFCRLTVDHTRGSGPGSLKAAIDCAIDGDTIRFASNVMNDTIQLGNQNLVVNKKLVIISDITKNIHIMSTSPAATIVNNIPATNQDLKIKGLHIHSSNAGIGAINNQGILTLDDVILYKWPSTSTATIQNSTGATTVILGNTKVVPD